MIGDLHHVLAAGAMTRSGVHAEFGEIVAGLKPARTTEEETIVFDSSGAAVYSRTVELGERTSFFFNA